MAANAYFEEDSSSETQGQIVGAPLFSPFFTFLRAIFFRPFSLSLAPTIYLWVSKDVTGQGSTRIFNRFFSLLCSLNTVKRLLSPIFFIQIIYSI